VLNLNFEKPFWHEDEEFWPEIDRHDPKYSAEGVDKWTFRRAGKSKNKKYSAEGVDKWTFRRAGRNLGFWV
jgi:hypothetical protein